MTLLDGRSKKTFISDVSAADTAEDPAPNHSSPTAMKFPFSFGFAAALCVMLASCYPYPENPPRRRANQAPQQLTAEQMKLQEQEALKKKQEEELKKTQQAQADATQNLPETTTSNTTTTQQTTTPSTEPKRTEYAVANKVPGKEGFVFSPYNNKVVDVRDIPSGTLVQDPTYPASEKKYFRVP